MEAPEVEINTNKKAKSIPIEEIVVNPNVPKFYGNGFQCGATLADSNLLVKLNDQPICLISMSLPALKTLHEQIGQILGIYANNFGIEIPTFGELTKKVVEKQSK